MVKIRDKSEDNHIVAEMPLFIWWLTRLPIGGYIIMSFRFDYGTGRHWSRSLMSAIKLAWHISH